MLLPLERNFTPASISATARFWPDRPNLKRDDATRMQPCCDLHDLPLVPGDEGVGLAVNPVKAFGPPFGLAL